VTLQTTKSRRKPDAKTMAETISSRVGRAFAKLLHIDLGVTPPVVTDETGTYSYYEHEPTVGDWLRGHMPTTPLVRRYIWGLFPFLHWIGYYNVQWLIGDLVAGERSPFELVKIYTEANL
jgi:sodium-independent sulfate anion transporter 11